MMKINNKFEIGQRVFFYMNGHAHGDIVRGFDVCVRKHGTIIVYWTEKDTSLSEDELFATHEDLETAVFNQTRDILFNDLIDFL